MLPAAAPDKRMASCDFPAYLAYYYPRLRPRRKFAFITAFGRFFASLHERGVATWEYSAAQYNVNVCRQSWSFELRREEPEALAGKALRPSQRRRGLVSLHAGFLTTSSRAERLRFYQAYRNDGQRLTLKQAELAHMDRAAIARARQEWRRQDKRLRGNNKEFAVERRGPFRIRRLRGATSETLLSHLLPEPDRLFAGGESFSRRGIGSESAKIEFAGRAFFLKRYGGRSWQYRLKSIFRHSRAYRVWKTSWGFYHRGLPVPRTLLLLEERRFLVLQRAYLVTEFQEQACPLMDAWPGLNEPEKDHYLARSAILLGRMHSFGCIHGDTNWENILIRDLRRDNRLLFVDLDCGRVTRFLTGRRAVRDVKHFERDLLRPHIGGHAKKPFFFQVWRRWCTRSCEADS